MHSYSAHNRCVRLGSQNLIRLVCSQPNPPERPGNHLTTTTSADIVTILLTDLITTIQNAHLKFYFRDITSLLHSAVYNSSKITVHQVYFIISIQIQLTVCHAILHLPKFFPSNSLTLLANNTQQSLSVFFILERQI